MRAWQWFYYGHWKKPLAALLIVIAYAALAGGITVACLSEIALGWRIAAPFLGLVIWGVGGFLGVELYGVYLSSSSLQRRREWRETPTPEKIIWAATFPCKGIFYVVIALAGTVFSFLH